MGRLDAALSRFSAAVDALEARLAAETNPDSELGRLRQERASLVARIAELEQQSSSLANLTETVETRLDGAIAEIRAALARS
jgi:hypothetical protein